MVQWIKALVTKFNDISSNLISEGYQETNRQSSIVNMGTGDKGWLLSQMGRSGTEKHSMRLLKLIWVANNLKFIDCLGMLVHTFNLSTLEREAGRSLGGQGKPGLYSEFQASKD